MFKKNEPDDQRVKREEKRDKVNVKVNGSYFIQVWQKVLENFFVQQTRWSAGWERGKKR